MEAQYLIACSFVKLQQYEEAFASLCEVLRNYGEDDEVIAEHDEEESSKVVSKLAVISCMRSYVRI